jgi:hypothetical protein
MIAHFASRIPFVIAELGEVDMRTVAKAGSQHLAGPRSEVDQLSVEPTRPGNSGKPRLNIGLQRRDGSADRTCRLSLEQRVFGRHKVHVLVAFGVRLVLPPDKRDLVFRAGPNRREEPVHTTIAVRAQVVLHAILEKARRAVRCA